MARKVRIYRSHPKGLSVGNFGDEITIPILERLFGLEAVSVPMQDAELIATGSILDAYSRSRPMRKLLVRVLSSRIPLHVWGSGFMLNESALRWPRPIVIHAVRGQLTASRVPHFSGAVGDPGILASRLVDRPLATEASVRLIPHFVDESYARNLELPLGWKITNPDGDTYSVIRDIASSDLVISSSLHGLIVADSFGIPAIWAKTHNSLHRKSTFKFYDHASARRSTFNEPISYEDAIRLSSDALQKIASVAERSIEAWQDEVTATFPRHFI